jgi:molybdenum cofactor sulfurtransferase
MDIPAHILDAVHTSSLPAPDASPSKRVKSASAHSRHSPSSTHFPHRYHAKATNDDQSSISDPEPDDYATDFTTPDSSMDSPDDVEDFRDREYPQLKGKTYLDHGGTTVRRTGARDTTQRH